MATELGPADVRDLEAFIARTELIAVGGNQWMGAMELRSGHTLYYYVARPGEVQHIWAAQDGIRDRGEWAIVHDHDEGRYELWIEGRKFGNLQEHELVGELAHCIADPGYR